MTDDIRLVEVETKVERIVVILEGEPIRNIDGDITGRKGGLVQQGERHTEGRNVMSHQLDNILAQLPRCWTRTQRISASMVVVVAFGSLSVWMF